MKKYELTNETRKVNGKKLFRIRALIDLACVKAGALGGFVESEKNLSHNGNAWIFDDAKVYDNAKVYGEAWVFDKAKVYGAAHVAGAARVLDSASVFGRSRVFDSASVYNSASVFGNAWVQGGACLCGDAYVGSNEDYLFAGCGRTPLDFATFFKNKNGQIMVSYGIFMVALDEFRAKVAKKHGGNKIAKIYQMMADMAELQILGKNQEVEK